MSGSDRKNRSDLIGSVLATPEAFDFDSALRLLRINAELTSAEGSLTQSALVDPSSIQAARFIANPSLAYPETELTNASAQSAEDVPYPTLAMNFFGLHGPTGVLPSHVTQAVATTGPEYSLSQVLDFFNNQFALEFAKAAELSQPQLLAGRTLSAEPASDDDAPLDPLTDLMTDLAGVGRGVGGHEGPRSRRNEQSIARYYAAAWRHRPMPLTSLQSMLRDLLDVPVRVLPFEPLWTSVETPWRLRLCHKPKSGETGKSAQRDAGQKHRSDLQQHAWVLGKRSRQAQGGVLIRIGPLNLRTFCRLLPPRVPEVGAFAVRKRLLWRICTLIGAALGPWADFVIQPVLSKDDVHQWVLRGHRKPTDKNSRAHKNSLEPAPATAKLPPPAVLGRTMFLLRKPQRPNSRIYPFETDFDKLKITSTAVRRSLKSRPARRNATETF